MQWFKHDTDASSDAKIKKLILRYGPIGYAVYFHCLELIAGNISESNITFELENDSEIIADNLKIKGNADKSARGLVEEIMLYIIELGLFEEKEGHIFCFRMLKRLDMSMTSNPKLREMISGAKANHDSVMINHDSTCKKRREEKRRDKNRTEERERTPSGAPSRFTKPTLDEVRLYLNSIGLLEDTQAGKFMDYHESRGWVVGKAPMKDWKAACRTWKRNYDSFSAYRKSAVPPQYDVESRKRELAALGYK